MKFADLDGERREAQRGLSGIDPDRRPGEGAHAIEENFATRGGNSIRIFGADLHTLWDHVPPAWGSQATDGFLASAKAVQATPWAAEALAATWATETVTLSPTVFAGLEFGPKVAVQPLTEPPLRRSRAHRSPRQALGWLSC